MESALNVIYISSEVTPYAKTGGLADIAGTLPVELSKLACNIIIVMPKYKIVDNEKFGLKELFNIEFTVSKDLETAYIMETKLQDKVKVYFIGNDNYYNRDQLYGTIEGDYPDNAKRFSFFCKATLELAKKIDFKPDIIHCNDWQTALVPIYIKYHYANDEFFKETKVMFTINNIVYQGLFEKETLFDMGLGWELFNIDQLEYWGKINLLKGGIVFSDIITTVSEKYSQEIQTPEYGAGLDGILKTRSKDLFGIVNGVDYSVWDPKIDKFIKPLNYSINNLKNKEKIKEKLLSEYKLPYKKNVPLIGTISRLTDQKGYDIIAEAIDKIMELDLQLVILGTGEKKYHDMLENIHSRFPEKIGIYLGFNEELAHKIEAGCDMFLMPSAYEPCGLNQLYSLRYGTVPIVRETGGLADTIMDLTVIGKKVNGTGFTFKEYSGQALLEKIKCAIEYYKNKQIWKQLIKNGMSQDWSWETSSIKYYDLYRKIKAI